MWAAVVRAGHIPELDPLIFLGHARRVEEAGRSRRLAARYVADKFFRLPSQRGRGGGADVQVRK